MKQNLFLNQALSKLAKDKGFDEECFGYYIALLDKPYWNIDKWEKDIGDYKFKYVKFDSPESTKNSSIQKEGYDIITAPLYQQVIDWIRIKHNIDVIICKESEGKYYFWITLKGDNTRNMYLLYKKENLTYHIDYYENYNKAIEVGLNLIP